MAEYKRKELVERVRTIRKQMGLTQPVLSEKAGLSIQHISSVENAHTKAIIGTIAAIANALSVSADRLLCDSLTAATTVSATEISDILKSYSST